MPNDALFSETQYFGKKWWPLLLPSSVVPLFVVLSQKNPFSADMAPEDVWGLLGLLAVLSSVWGLFFVMRLQTRIDEDGIYVQFRPFHFRPLFFPWEKIDRANVRTYSPLGEYGGWGLRYGFSKGRAYNVWGSKGLQLELADGKKVLIGTQRAEELENALLKRGK
jgi:hypothetical protein